MASLHHIILHILPRHEVLRVIPSVPGSIDGSVVGLRVEKCRGIYGVAPPFRDYIVNDHFEKRGLGRVRDSQLAKITMPAPHTPKP